MKKGMTLVETIIATTLSVVLGMSMVYFFIFTQKIQPKISGRYMANKTTIKLEEYLHRYISSSTQNIYDITISDDEKSITFYSTITSSYVTISFNENMGKITLNDGNNSFVLADNIVYCKFEKVGGSLIKYTIIYKDTETLGAEHPIKRVLIGAVAPRVP